MASPLTCALDVRASLGECPIWSVPEQALYWVDINAPSIPPPAATPSCRCRLPSAALRRSRVPSARGVASWHRDGKLLQISPAGVSLAEFAIPALCPKMCAFGGPDLRTLYVTSARQMRDDDERARLPQSGGIFSMHVDTPGLPETHFAG